MYIGIDYSSRKVSAARLDQGGRLNWLFSYSVPKNSTDPLENLNLIAAEYHHSRSMNVDCASYNYVSIEAPIVGGSGAARTALNMAMVAGVLARYEHKQNSIVTLVPPATWKRTVCGKGNMSKDQVSKWLGDYYPSQWERCTNDDEVDAVCLAMYAMTTATLELI